MPIAKGRPWGAPGPVPPDAVMVHSDAEAREVLERCRLAKQPFPPLRLLGGDLSRTLGGAPGRPQADTGDGVHFTVDVGEVLVDGRMHLFVAHLVARSWLWSQVFVAMNAQWIGRWNAGPRAHPNDGVFDFYDARLSLNQRLLVRTRLHHGTHLPHPAIAERRSPAVHVELRAPVRVYLDGTAVGRARAISVRCRPDALVVCV